MMMSKSSVRRTRRVLSAEFIGLILRTRLRTHLPLRFGSRSR